MFRRVEEASCTYWKGDAASGGGNAAEKGNGEEAVKRDAERKGGERSEAMLPYVKPKAVKTSPKGESPQARKGSVHARDD